MPEYHDNHRLLFVVRSANFQSTSDQAFTKVGTFTTYMPTKVVGKRVSGGATVTCLGGIYTGANKTGNAIVPAAQSWLGMSGADKTQDATLAAIAGTDVHTATPILSLSTGSTGAVAGDVFIFGLIMD